MVCHRRSLWPALLGLATLIASPPVLAQSKACKADLDKICPGVEAGHGRILACLEGKTDQLSAACKDDVSKKLTAVYKACKPDAEKFCAGVEMGGGRVLQCLGDNEASLSKSCKKAWGQGKDKKAAAK